MDSQEQPTRVDIAPRWFGPISFVLTIFLCGIALGFYQGVTYVTDEVEARFTCEPK